MCLDYDSIVPPLQECARFSLWLGLTLGRLTVFLSNISTILFRISFSLLPFRKPSLSYGLFSSSAISSDAALIWPLDDLFGMVYYVGNSWSHLKSKSFFAEIYNFNLQY